VRREEEREVFNNVTNQFSSSLTNEDVANSVGGGAGGGGGGAFSSSSPTYHGFYDISKSPAVDSWTTANNIQLHNTGLDLDLHLLCTLECSPMCSPNGHPSIFYHFLVVLSL